MTESSGIRLDLYRGREWIVIFRGLVAIAFGVLAFAWANASLRRLALLFGIYAVSHAFLSIIAAVGKRGEPGCGLLGTEAIVGFFAGAITFVTRSASAKAVVFFIWLWAIATGMLRIAEGIQMRKHRPGGVWLILSGLAATFLGVLSCCVSQFVSLRRLRQLRYSPYYGVCSKSSWDGEANVGSAKTTRELTPLAAVLGPK